MIDRRKMDRDIERRHDAEDRPAMEACERHIDAVVEAKYVGGDADIPVDLSSVRPQPSARVLDKLVAAYSKPNSGFTASWRKRGGAVTFLVKPAPIDAKPCVRRVAPLVPSRERPDHPWPGVRPHEPYVYRHERKPGDPMVTWCSTVVGQA